MFKIMTFLTDNRGSQTATNGDTNGGTTFSTAAIANSQRNFHKT